MIIRLTAAAAILSLAPLTAAMAQDADPDWPCVQQLIPKIAAAQVWNGPTVDENLAMTAPPELSELGRNAMDPKVSADAAVKSLKTYFAKVKSRPRLASEIPTVFIVALTDANGQREREINGIKGFTRGQFALSKKLAEDASELDKLTQGQLAKEGTPEKNLEDRVSFERRMFEDNEHQVKYLCEAPGESESRIGLIAKTLEQMLPK